MSTNGKRRARSVNAWGQFGIGMLVVVNTELALRVTLPVDSHVFGQRQAEVYGWLSIVALLLVLAARPLRIVTYRRALGLGAFAFAVAHTCFAYVHVLGGDWENLLFLSVSDQAGIWAGVVALVGLAPLALTSTNWAMRKLGPRWKALHRLGPVMTFVAALHTAWVGVHFGLRPVTLTSALLLTLSGTLLVLRGRTGKVRK